MLIIFFVFLAPKKYGYTHLLYVHTFVKNFQSGVSEVIYFVEKRSEDSKIAYVAAEKLLSMAGVKVSSTLVAS